MDDRKVFIDPQNNLLKLEEPIYTLVDVDMPNIFPICFPMMRYLKLHSMIG